MNKNSLPRGIRNNNPANIVRSGSKWLGLSKVQNDSRFCQFDDMKYGVRAFFVLALTYRKKFAINTVRGFIERFAPAKENNVSSYVNFILLHPYLSDGLLRTDYSYSYLLYQIIKFENDYSDVDMYCSHLCAFQLDAIRDDFNIKIV